MKFSVSSNALNKAVAKVAPGISKTTNPVLLNYSVRVVDGQLFMASSDEEIFLQSTMPVNADEDFDLLTDASFFTNIVKVLPETMLTIESVDYTKLRISTDTGEYYVNYSSEQNFPQIPLVEKESIFTIPGKVLREAIEGALFAVDKNNQARMAICGMLFDFTPEALVIVGTDGHKLIRRTLSNFTFETPSSIVVPEKTVGILLKSLDNSDVTMYYSQNYVHFQMDDFYIISKLITQKFPSYNNVIPRENENILTVDRRALASAVRRMLVFANPRYQQIKLSISDTQLKLSSEDSNSQSRGEDTLPCTYRGDAMDISFNPTFLHEVLNHLTSENVIIQMDTPTRAVVLFPDKQDSETEEVLSLLMPVRLTSHS